MTRVMNEQPILSQYERLCPGSRRLFERSLERFPSGVTHDSRYMRPFPIFVDRAIGSRKWDVDGNEYVDYFGGHGALLLGHNDPTVVEAVQRALERGTHFGACHELELEWADLVTRMIPSAEKVRFTSSGTEASQLVLRLARAATGRRRIVRFLTNFHGWHDQVAFAQKASFDGSPPAGVLSETVEQIVVLPPNDLDAVRQLLAEDDDVAAVILEPTGASFGQVPTDAPYLKGLREVTAQHGVLLIFDEVITGFRCSPGGAQGFYEVKPDLTLLAKAMAGGYPGGAIVGSADLMDFMSFRDGDVEWNQRHRVAHQGTFNANPVSAAAGIATLKIIASSDVCERATAAASQLRDALNDVIREGGFNWLVYGEFSGFHLLVPPEDTAVTLEDIYSGSVHYSALKKGPSQGSVDLLRAGFLCGGVDVGSWPGGWVSAVHSPRDIDASATAMRRLISLWKGQPAPA